MPSTQRPPLDPSSGVLYFRNVLNLGPYGGPILRKRPQPGVFLPRPLIWEMSLMLGPYLGPIFLEMPPP
jgi:hypothetical protein